LRFWPSWPEVGGGQRAAVFLPPFDVSPQDSGKLYAPVHRFVKEAPMAETRISYHKEVKTASFQGRTITLENLTPIQSPKAQDKRKREIESCLFEVFIKYAPGRAQVV
ncbi:hypothetical protein, partial [uncultured Oscillibacter sp.]|uniref:hypothetical protein n=1 Tax=uncultured Oscillibacter sp. TaxID=876091 RepID=UPI0034568B25